MLNSSSRCTCWGDANFCAELSKNDSWYHCQSFQAGTSSTLSIYSHRFCASRKELIIIHLSIGSLKQKDPSDYTIAICIVSLFSFSTRLIQILFEVVLHFLSNRQLQNIIQPPWADCLPKYLCRFYLCCPVLTVHLVGQILYIFMMRKSIKSVL